MIYEIKDLRFAYPGSSRQVLNGVSLSIEQGDVLSILGPNGAGKSTLLTCMMALNKPQTGKILVDGKGLEEMTAQELAKKVSFVPQNLKPVFGYTVLEFVLMGRAPLISALGRPGKEDRYAAFEALEKMGLKDLADRPYTEISGGEMQQASIARAIVRKPEVILFDEPTAHLDFGNQLRTLKVIKELSGEGYTTVITTHNPDHAIMLGGRAAILNKEGKLMAGSTEELVTEENLRTVYNSELKIRYIEELGRNVCLYPNI
ncbi:MAG: ABC transporter ATP-binding protein [Bacillota bacterium]|nr:ABC transporter ATP-binding protein [Bacillota bacterium]